MKGITKNKRDVEQTKNGLENTEEFIPHQITL